MLNAPCSGDSYSNYSVPGPAGSASLGGQARQVPVTAMHRLRKASVTQMFVRVCRVTTEVTISPPHIPNQGIR